MAIQLSLFQLTGSRAQGFVEKRHRLRFCNQEIKVIEYGGAFKVELVAHLPLDTPGDAAEFPRAEAVLGAPAGTGYARDRTGYSA
jgi:hypothetical protein